MRVRFVRGGQTVTLDVNYFRFHIPDAVAIARTLDGQLIQIAHDNLIDAYWPRGEVDDERLGSTPRSGGMG